jgi:hypothetical protein
MKTAELRDKMQSRVKETYEKYRGFEDIPVFDGKAAAGPSVAVMGLDSSAYVTALHEFFAIDPDKIQIAGRQGRFIVGK